MSPLALLALAVASACAIEPEPAPGSDSSALFSPPLQANCPCGVCEPDLLPVIAQDTFDRPPSPLVGTTPVGGFGWVEGNPPETGHVRIDGNAMRVHYLAGGDERPSQWVNLAELETDDFVIETTLEALAGGPRHGIAYRLDFQDGRVGDVDPGRGYYVEVRDDRIELRAGRTLLDSWQADRSFADRAVDLRVIANGRRHCVFADGQRVIETTDDLYRRGYLGFWGVRSTFDVEELTVRDIPFGTSDPAEGRAIFDDFERPDHGSLGNEPHGGHRWVEAGFAPDDHQRIVDGRVLSHYFNGGSAPNQYANISTFTARNIDFSVRLQGFSTTYMTGGRFFGPSWRLASAHGDFDDPGYHLRVAAEGLALYAGDQQIGASSTPIDTRSHLYRVVSSGSRHRIYMDGELALDVLDDRYPDAGAVGVAGRFAIYYFDDVAVTELPAPPPVFPQPAQWAPGDGSAFQGAADDFERADGPPGSTAGGSYRWVVRDPDAPNTRVAAGALFTHYFVGGTNAPSQWANLADFSVENVDLEVQAAGWPNYMGGQRAFGLSYRMPDPNGDFDAPGYHVRINGGWIRLYAGSVVVAEWLGATDTDWHRYRVRAVGDRHQVFRDDELIIDAIDGAHDAAGHVGLFSLYSIARFDGFHARAVPASGGDPRDEVVNIGFYSVDERRAAEVAATGIRSVHRYWHSTTPEDQARWVAGVGTSSLATRAPVSDFVANCAGTGECSPACASPSSDADIAERIDGLAGFDNIAWWEMPEELRWWCSTELGELDNLLRSTRLHDPLQRPTHMYFAPHYGQTGFEQYMDSLDIFGAGVRVQDGLPRAVVRYKVEELVSAIRGSGHQVGPDYRGDDRIPMVTLPSGPAWSYSDAETYHDVFLALASGALGVQVWSYWNGMSPGVTGLDGYARAASTIGDPANDLSAPLLVGSTVEGLQVEVTNGPATVGPFLPPSGEADVSYPSVHALTKLVAGQRYIIAVHTGSSPVTARLSNAGLDATVEVLHEARTVEMTGGVLTDDFEPWAVHIYRFPSAPLGGN